MYSLLSYLPEVHDVLSDLTEIHDVLVLSDLPEIHDVSVTHLRSMIFSSTYPRSKIHILNDLPENHDVVSDLPEVHDVLGDQYLRSMMSACMKESHAATHSVAGSLLFTASGICQEGGENKGSK